VLKVIRSLALSGVTELYLVRSMASTRRDRIRPWALVGMAAALIAAALFFYTDHPVRDSNLYTPSVPGWISIAIFIGIGVVMEIVRIRDQRRHARKINSDATR
jgi:Na+/melibiose symporter-like transporter